MELWEWSIDNLKDTKMKARVRGVKSYMETFDFLFCCSLGERLLKQTDNLSRALQNSTISAAQGQQLAHDVVKTIYNDRNETHFELFWERILRRQKDFSISDPKILRKRKMPEYFGQTDDNTHYYHP